MRRRRGSERGPVLYTCVSRGANMIKKWILALSLVTLVSWAAFSWADAGGAKGILSSASKALGADNLKTIEFSGSGADFVIGQAASPSSPWPKFKDKTYTRVIDLEPPASRLQRIRTQGENPPRGGGQQPVIGEQNQTQVIAAGSPQAATLQDELMMTVPYSFLRAAAKAPDATVKSQSMGGKKNTVVSFTAMNKAPARGYINEQNILEKVETKIDNTVLGDIPYEATFADYKDFGGVKFPTHIVQKQGGYPVLDLTVTDVKPNAPANITSGGAPPAGGLPPATSEKLGDGVFLILGGYAAMAVD